MIVCADDFGLGDDIDEAILDLAKDRRLSAVSCLVVLERCTRESAARLLPLRQGLDLGLHLCLTTERLPLSPAAGLPARGDDLPSFPTLLRRSLGRQLSSADIQAQIAAQYDLFAAKFSRPPDYIDGHLHAHQLPVVREALVNFVLGLPPATRPYVRNTHLPLRELWKRRLPWTKAALIGGLGRKMKAMLRDAGLRTNAGFAGIYDFRQWNRYPEYFPNFVDCVSEPTGMLVVHPGTKEAWRRQEFETLKESFFPLGRPGRFSVAPAPAD